MSYNSGSRNLSYVYVDISVEISSAFISLSVSASVAHLHRVPRLDRPAARADRHGAQARPRARRQLDLRLPPLSGMYVMDEFKSWSEMAVSTATAATERLGLSTLRFYSND